jgi:C4-dicarboxylate transporter DctM subunit
MALYGFWGCFLDPASILVLTIPILFPIVMRLGFDPIWFGVIVTMNMELADITRPVGLNLFVVKGISLHEVSLEHVVKGSMPFMVLLVLGMFLIILFPEIALWLPNRMMGR